jgi:hypothetical protein
MEPEGSLPNSQKLSACSYPEPDHTTPTYLPKTLPNIHPPTFLSSQWSLSLRLSHEFLFSPIRAQCHSHLILLNLLILIILGEEYNPQSSSLCSFLQPSRHLTPPRSKYPPQHPIPKHPQSMFLP